VAIKLNVHDLVFLLVDAEEKGKYVCEVKQYNNYFFLFRIFHDSDYFLFCLKIYQNNIFLF